MYDVVVASDEGLGGDPEAEPTVQDKETTDIETEQLATQPEDDEEEGDEEEAVADEEPKAGPSTSNKRKTAPPAPKRKKRRGDPSSSLARGIDFTSASTVINFDLPQSTTSYMHRVGRTARAGHSGLALSFVVPSKQWGKDRTTMLKSAKRDEEVFERIKKRVGEEDSGAMIKEWDFGGRGKEIDGFRYRMEDALRSVTTKRVSDARREEVRRELLNSEKLKVSL